MSIDRGNMERDMAHCIVTTCAQPVIGPNDEEAKFWDADRHLNHQMKVIIGVERADCVYVPVPVIRRPSGQCTGRRRGQTPRLLIDKQYVAA
jgi:hypothetical protein